MAGETQGRVAPGRRRAAARPAGARDGARLGRGSGAALGRLRIAVQGAVQGVGFRPFVFREATGLGLAGWVRNDAGGVFIEVEGPRHGLDRFLDRLKTDPPPRARIHDLSVAPLRPLGARGFAIVRSRAGGERTVAVPPDTATCADCLAEVSDPCDRRHLYPFTNCTDCGPRFTIIRDLPYDRPLSTMARFTMCGPCRREYDDPSDRRFHAQPNACPDCGPRLALLDPAGNELARSGEALERAAQALAAGHIVAVKGLGGYHLMADARRADVVDRLRRRKLRAEKPLALMVRDLGAARSLCHLPEGAAAILASAEAPILLLPRRCEAAGPERPAAEDGADPRAVADNVAPGSPDLGVMLPATPLHHLLLRATGFPLVATSGNLSDEPICTDEAGALARLGRIADLFLAHDRPIARHVDDSVGRVMRGELRLLRRSRGYAPLPVLMRRSAPAVLAVGAHLKSTVALGVGRRVFLSQHIGDLDTPESRGAFERVIGDFLRLYEAAPVAIAHDRHPDYASTRWARAAAGVAAQAPAPPLLAGARLVAVQHHHAHLASCLADNGVDGRALGVTWDGTGYGADGTIWGGEFLRGSAASFERVAHLRPFKLPGGEAAVREGRRAALALLWDLLGDACVERVDLAPVRAFAPAERSLVIRMLGRGLNAPVTTSAGRLFDAVAALLDLRQVSSFEGQAAMLLESVADPHESGAYPLPLDAGAARGEAAALDWRPLVAAILDDLRRGASAPRVSARFHNALAIAIVAVARAVGEPRVALCGGCFQNRLLAERAASGLEAAGFEVLLHRQVPPNDGGLSLGQVAVAAARLAAGAADDRLED